VVRAREESRDGNKIVAHFTVSDTGLGIPAEKRESIFQAFTQADGSTTRKFGGTGLGLTISRKLVEIMGGRIWVESVVGQGSSFHFTVPFALAREVKKKATATQRSLQDVRVLVVDDNDTSRGILEKTLAGFGMKVMAAANASEAMQDLTQQRFEVMLLDWAMPDVNGLELCERIHRMGPEAVNGMILMLGSRARRQDVTRCRELGVQTYLTKPVQPDELRAAIGSIFGEKSEIGPQFAVDARSSRSLRILLVEDNRVNQQVASALLSKRGHSVVIAGDGLEAIAAVGRESFDLVLMDVQLPGMDGFQTTKRIRENEANSTHPLPIIALTAHAMKGDQEKCLAAGMDGYISKPININDLTREMERLIGGTEAILETTLAMPVVTKSNSPLVNREELMTRVDGDLELLRSMIEIFLEDAPQSLKDMHAALEANNAASLSRLAHALKGAISNFSSDAVTDVALRLETLAIDEDLPRAQEAYRELEGILKRLTPELTEIADLSNSAR
jgi:CheY-like chemotaxis protein